MFRIVVMFVDNNARKTQVYVHHYTFVYLGRATCRMFGVACPANTVTAVQM